MKMITVIIIMSVMVMTLAGCERMVNDKKSLSQFITKAKKQKHPQKVKKFQKTITTLVPKITFTQRNPFISVATVEHDALKYPLVKFTLSSLTLVGIVMDPITHNNQGLFIAPDKKMYTVHQGDFIGKVGAKINKIDYNNITIRSSNFKVDNKKIHINKRGVQ